MTVRMDYLDTGLKAKGEEFSILDLLSARESANEYFIFPGFCDVHVHFREPGFFYKENILTGSNAAAHGGYTAVCTMPNLNPVPDTKKHLEEELKAIRSSAVIKVLPYGSITMGEQGKELSDMAAMADDVVAFSDDGRGVQDPGMMREAMSAAKSLGKLIVAHCEDNSLLPAPESEWKQIERDIKLAQETGCGYHVCHISCAESAELVREAKKSGIDVSCETAPHYLLLNDCDVLDDGRFKMNPPIRTKKDQEALLEGICDGTIELIATDHAPHSAEEKSRGFAKSLSGIVGLETAFPALYTKLVKTGIISLQRLVDLMAYNPRKRFGIPMGTDFTVWDLNEESIVDPETFLSMGRSTPFAGWNVYGKCILTVSDGKIVYKSQERRNG